MKTDKLEVDGWILLSPSLHQCSILRVFKASQSYTVRKERSWNKEVMSAGIKLGTSCTEGSALTDCATLALSVCLREMSIMHVIESQTKGVKRGRDQVLVSILPRCLSYSSVCLERADCTFLLWKQHLWLNM